MTIDWGAFTPGMALLGGALIGLSAAIFVLINGRVAGISGILGGLMTAARGDRAWRVAFLAGMIAAPWLYHLAVGLPEAVIEANTPMLLLAGVLVGIGTRYGSGCTSGHGVCGLSRFSLRSLVATLTFMAAGFAMVYAIRHAFGA